MKKLNTNSDVYYLEKAVFFAPLQLAKAHIVDDDCNEFIVTIKKTPDTFFSRGYISPDEIIIIDYEEYTEEKWKEMVKYIEYERAVII